ncbi:MAG: WhiB family transcriptional regulator [Intrasporangium sp.]|uniref:WhiB family transcriptional regulator n=1 Tax=Intrasporangium sp. TaxID=1925024 RepID=UPI00264A0828|nr:WhiB family transcriptional regulator [Intrasporangium sp.]MDN5797058.1 WhiB family transcriptional regulator [Intrasporangium sp.]
MALSALHGLVPVRTGNEQIPCVEHDADLWFAQRPGELDLAKRLCQSCPLRAECLAAAIDRREPWGVWGGQIFVDGVVVARKRGPGRPPKTAAA